MLRLFTLHHSKYNRCDEYNIIQTSNCAIFAHFMLLIVTSSSTLRYKCYYNAISYSVQCPFFRLSQKIDMLMRQIERRQRQTTFQDKIHVHCYSSMEGQDYTKHNDHLLSCQSKTQVVWARQWLQRIDSHGSLRNNTQQNTIINYPAFSRFSSTDQGLSSPGSFRVQNKIQKYKTHQHHSLLHRQILPPIFFYRNTRRCIKYFIIIGGSIRKTIRGIGSSTPQQAPSQQRLEHKLSRPLNQFHRHLEAAGRHRSNLCDYIDSIYLNTSIWRSTGFNNPCLVDSPRFNTTTGIWNFTATHTDTGGPHWYTAQAHKLNFSSINNTIVRQSYHDDDN